MDIPTIHTSHHTGPPVDDTVHTARLWTLNALFPLPGLLSLFRAYVKVVEGRSSKEPALQTHEAVSFSVKWAVAVSLGRLLEGTHIVAVKRQWGGGQGS